VVGMEVFWPLKDLSLDDEVTTTRLEQCCVTTDNCINLRKKQVSCKDEAFLEVYSENVSEVKELGDMKDFFVTNRLIWNIIIPQIRVRKALLKV
jgi:hypothetical protein